jgi:hypothetical protein
MNDRVITVLPTHLPTLCAPTPQEGTEVIGINEDPCIYRQGDHLLRGIGVKEIALNRWVTIYLMAEVVQGIQKRLRVGLHAAEAGEIEHYSDGRFLST